ncbi:MAG TPA: nucleotidyl transferase AbiEii/AbiGii toxin family protein [Trebonia sp.]|jgi:predicted nucleotidyltransferase component of viral defense system|nr:nucleotidyl transferase AbiEii/AbiGii toxin family protein [Trebonia sp.]
MALLAGDHAFLVEIALPVCARYGLAITGGYAVKAHGLVDRPSEDIDFATSHPAPVEEMTEALAASYRQAGCQAQVLNTGGRFGHLDVVLPSGGACRVDILKEPLNHEPAMMAFGPVVALADVVALKVGALHDRGVIRDVIDVHAASKIFSETELVTMARAALDDEFRFESLRDQLDRAQMYPDEEFALYGLDANQSAAIRVWAIDWSARLSMEMAEAEPWSEDGDWTDDE